MSPDGNSNSPEPAVFSVSAVAIAVADDQSSFDHPIEERPEPLQIVGGCPSADSKVNEEPSPRNTTPALLGEIFDDRVLEILVADHELKTGYLRISTPVPSTWHPHRDESGTSSSPNETQEHGLRGQPPEAGPAALSYIDVRSNGGASMPDRGPRREAALSPNGGLTDERIR